MRKIAWEQLDEASREFVAASRLEKVVVTREGEPFALIVGVQFKDEEDLQYQTSPEFWRMIEERRRDTRKVSLEQVKAKLNAEEELSRGNGSVATSKEPVQQP